MGTPARPGPLIALALALSFVPTPAHAFHKKTYVVAAPTYAAPAPTTYAAPAPVTYVAQAPAPTTVYYQAQAAPAPTAVVAAASSVGAAPADDATATNQILSANLRAALLRDLIKSYGSKDNAGNSVSERVSSLRETANESYASMLGVDSADELGAAPKQDIDLLIEQVVGLSNTRVVNPAAAQGYAPTVVGYPQAVAGYAPAVAAYPMAAPAGLILVQPVTPVLVAPVAPHHGHLHRMLHHYPYP